MTAQRTMCALSLDQKDPPLALQDAHAGGTEFTVSVDHVDREWQLSMIVIEPRSDGRCVAFTLGWLVVLVCVFVPGHLHAGVPTDQVRSTVDEALKILNNPNLRSAVAKEQRRRRLRQVIYPRFDFAEMARRSLGPTWRRVSPEEQQEFVRLFTDLAESYVNNIESYNGEKILNKREIQEKEYAGWTPN
jgi:hypothetical protein